MKYRSGSFTRQYHPTAGIDFSTKKIVLPGGVNVTVHLWDVGGSALHGNMLDKYLYGVDVILLVYDITNCGSFADLEQWLDATQKAVESAEKKPRICLIANKCDLEHQRAVRSDRHQKFALEHGLSTYQVSARTGEMVALCIQKMVAEALGLRLTRAEQEEQQPVIEAEISRAEPGVASGAARPVASSSSICCLQ
ncbi:ras-related protein Rab-28-like isoform X2 [Bacillus rossius redtenbacheri]